MKIIHRGYEPKVDASACIAPTAALVGKVEVGARSRVMYGAVVDSEASRVTDMGSDLIIDIRAGKTSL